MSQPAKQTTLYLVAYDISDDRRRTKVHRVLSGFGKWTQYSVFEVFLNEKELVALRGKLDVHLRPGEDSVRFYPLCAACMAKVRTVGSPPPAEERSYIV